MAQSNTEAARAYLIDRRNRLASEISVLEGRMTEINYLLSELDTPVGVMPRAPLILPKATVVAKQRKQIIHEALIAAGPSGLTRDEASSATGILLGTTSSTLSLLKTAGKATHKAPRYFAVLNDTAP